MNVMAKIQDNATVDARNRDNTRRQSNAQTSDDTQQFDGVLSDVKSDANTATSKSTATKSAPADDQPTTVAAAGTMSALLELLDKGTSTTGPAATATDDPATSPKAAKAKVAANADDDIAAGALQKIAVKDALAAAADTQTASAQQSASPAPPDLVSLLMLGSAAAVTTATNSAASAQDGAAAKKNSAAAVPGARDMPLDGSDHTSDKEVIVSGVSIETHLAPAAPNNSAALADPHRKATKQDLPSLEPDASKPDVTATALDATSQIGIALSAPVRSIANAVVELASRPETSTAAAAGQTSPTEQSKPLLGVARTMTLQMNPANLGTVDIRMHMTGQSLDVQLSVSDPRTLGIVSRERDALANALGDQNYALNSLVIQDGGAAASSGGNNAASQGDTSGSNARPERQNGGFGSDGQGGGNKSAGQGANRNFPDEQGAAADAAIRAGTSVRSGSLFV